MDKYIKLENALRTLCADCFWNDGRCKDPCRDYKRLEAIQEEKVEPIRYASWEKQEDGRFKCSSCGLQIRAGFEAAGEAAKQEILPRRCVQCGAHIVLSFKKEGEE